MFSVNGSNPWGGPQQQGPGQPEPDAGGGGAPFSQYQTPQFNAAQGNQTPAPFAQYQTPQFNAAMGNSSAMGPQPDGGQSSAGNNFFSNPQFENYSGYNPSQHATLGTANNLALHLGGNVMQTQMAPGSPFAVPGQNSIYLGGENPLNAGLLAERYAKYGRELADQMTRDELRIQNPGGSPSYGQLDSVFKEQPGGRQNLRGGSIFAGDIGRNYAPGAVGLGTAGNSGQSQGFQNFQGGGFPGVSPTMGGNRAGFGGQGQFGGGMSPGQGYGGSFGGRGSFGSPYQGFVGGLGRSQNFMRANPFGSSFSGYRARQPQLGGGMYSALRGNPFLLGAMGAGAGSGSGSPRSPFTMY